MGSRARRRLAARRRRRTRLQGNGTDAPARGFGRQRRDGARPGARGRDDARPARVVQVSIGLATVAFIVVLTEGGAVGDARRCDGRTHPRGPGARLGALDRGRALGAALVLLILQPVSCDRSVSSSRSRRPPAWWRWLPRSDRGSPADARARRGGGRHDARGAAGRDTRPAVPLPRRTRGHAARERIAAPTVAPSLLLGLVAAGLGIVSEPVGQPVGALRPGPDASTAADRERRRTGPRRARHLERRPGRAGHRHRSRRRAHGHAPHRVAPASPGGDRQHPRGAVARVELGDVGRASRVAHRAVPRRRAGRRRAGHDAGRGVTMPSTAVPTRSRWPPDSRRSA